MMPEEYHCPICGKTITVDNTRKVVIDLKRVLKGDGGNTLNEIKKTDTMYYCQNHSDSEIISWDSTY